MLKDRTHKLAAGAWTVVAIFLSAGLLAQAADVSDGLDASTEAAESVLMKANATDMAETENGTEVASNAANDTVEAVTPPESAILAGTEDDTGGEALIEPSPEDVEGDEEVVLTVCLNGCGYATIQAAVEAAEDGEVVEVGSGTYNENVVVDKSITLRGVNTGEGVPVLNAQASGNAVSGSAVTLQADGIVLEGLYITNAGPYPRAGIEVVSDDNLITGCGIWNCGYWGIYLKGGSTNNTVSECISSNNGNDGIMVFRSPGNFFRDNIVGNNGDNGIQILESDNNVIDSNVVGNNTNSGVYIDSSQNSMVMNNIISYNSRGIQLISSGIDRVGPNRFLNNTRELEVA